MKITLLLFTFCFAIISYSQTEKKSMIEYVEVLNNNQSEALYYYKNNWQQLRNIALEKGYIDSYQLLETKYTKETPYNFILITTYKNQNQYNTGEEKFQKIIKASDGLKLMNNKKPSEFRHIIFKNDKVAHWN